MSNTNLGVDLKMLSSVAILVDGKFDFMITEEATLGIAELGGFEVGLCRCQYLEMTLEEDRFQCSEDQCYGKDESVINLITLF